MAGTELVARFALTSLAVWRVTHLLVDEDGPVDAVTRMRARLGQRRLGELMNFFYCASVWVAAPASFAVARRHRELPVAWLALSGAACLLERVTAEDTAVVGALEPQSHGRPGTVASPVAQMVRR